MYRLVFSILVSCVLLLKAPSAAHFPIDEDWGHPIHFRSLGKSVHTRADTNYRLSSDAEPINYNVFLNTRLHLDDPSFSGEVKITFRSTKNAENVTLHARQLKISEAELKDLKTNDTTWLFVKEDKVTELLTFGSTFVEPLNLIAGQEYVLTIKYTGTLRRDNGGFYLSSYVNEDGEEVDIATTQFEATDARHAFPCFDEPGYKATFDIAIRHGYEFHALSNMPVNHVENTTSTEQTTYFETTPKMSTYLVAFIVSNFVSTAARQGNVLHRVFSRPEVEKEHSFALKTSLLALDFLSTYLDVSYNLPKMDNVAIPDFAAGAMENWGLVTYREEYLLFNEGKSTVNTELNIAIMMAHEFAHQWFGNLVTPFWWQFLWLNEGFATLFEYITVNEIYPQYNVMENFVVAHVQRALLSDGQKSPRAMSTYVEDPSSISNLFDSVSYSKSGSVLRMFQHVLSESTFQRGLNDYLKTNAYGGVDQDILFTHLIAAVGSENIPGIQNAQLKGFFESWTMQGGYPVLTVTRDYSKGTFEIQQEFFDNTNAPTSNVTFVVPFNYVYGNSPNFTSTRPDGFLHKESKVTVNSTGAHSANDWLLLNKDVTGYYRVNYDEKNWKLLTDQLSKDHKKILATNRAQLIDDSVRLAFADRLDSSVALSLMEYLKNEESYAPWATANNAFSAINVYFLGDKDYYLYQYYIGSLVSTFYKKVGITENSTDTMHRKLTRTIAIEWACKSDVGGCQDDANKRLNEVIDNNVEVEPSLKVAIFCNGLLKGGEKEFVYIFRRILDSKDQAERRQLMPTLGCSRNETLLLEFAKTSTAYSVEINYRVQERTNVLSAVISKNEYGLRAAMEFLKEYHEEYYQLAGAGFMDNNPLLTIMSTISSRIYTTELVEQFNALVEEVKKGPAGNAPQFATMLTRAQSNLEWVSQNRGKYMKWLSTFRNGGTSVVFSSVILVFTAVVSIRSYF